LSVVEFTLLQRRVREAEPVRGLPDLAEHLGPVPVDHLRPHHADILDPLRRFDQPGDRVGRQQRVVVEEQDVIGGRGQVRCEAAGQRGGEPDVLVQPDDPLGAEGLLEQMGRIVGGTVVDGEHAEPRMGLVGKAEQALREPRGAVLRHQHDKNARWLDTFCRANARR